MRRGAAVDGQVSRLAGCSARTREGAKTFKLTRACFEALERFGIEPLCGQRTVAHRAGGLATAVDVLGYNANTGALSVIELKTGYCMNRTAPAVCGRGRPCKMRGPLRRCDDTVINRHFAQLAATSWMLEQEVGTTAALRRAGVTQVEALLLYVDDATSQLHVLPGWWRRRAARIVAALAASA